MLNFRYSFGDKMVTFNFCGSSSLSCADYFLLPNASNLNFISSTQSETTAQPVYELNETLVNTFVPQITYLKTFRFDVVSGVNNLTVNETDVYPMGTLILVMAKVYVQMIQTDTTDPTDYADYEFNGYSVSRVSNDYRLCFRVITTRYLFTTRYYDNRHWTYSADTLHTYYTPVSDYTYMHKTTDLNYTFDAFIHEFNYSGTFTLTAYVHNKDMTKFMLNNSAITITVLPSNLRNLSFKYIEN